MTEAAGFRGIIPASKSILNRLLVLQSFEPGLKITGDSEADDVKKMKSALRQLQKGEVADCGAAGTTFRFLALRAARMPGEHRLTGSERLFARPQTEILRVLNQLGCDARIEGNVLFIHGAGWHVGPAGLRIERGVSSQFASAVVLSAWNLTDDLRLIFEGAQVSEGYLDMTLHLAAQAGMQWRREVDGLTVCAGARPKPEVIEAESDVSSAFAVAALAAVSGNRAIFEHWPEQSLQPDAVFPQILEDMGCRIERGERRLSVQGPRVLHPIDFDLCDSPDLCPVLAVLCALADGASTLSGAPHLVHKESSRIQKSAELARMLGAEVEELPDGLWIQGQPGHAPLQTNLVYDPEHDHRLAMAAAVANASLRQPRIQILRPQVVIKSFPEFWSIADGFAQMGGS